MSPNTTKDEPKQFSIYFFFNGKAFRVPERVKISQDKLKEELAQKTEDKKHYTYKKKLIYNLDGTEPKNVEKLNDEAAFVLVPSKSAFIPDDYQLFYDTYIDLEKQTAKERKKRVKKKKKKDKGYEFKPSETCEESQKKPTCMQKFKSLFKSSRSPKWKQRMAKPGSPKPKPKKKVTKDKTKYPIERKPVDSKKREEMKKRNEKEKEKNLKKAEGLYPKKHCCVVKEILNFEEKSRAVEEKKTKRFLENPEYKPPKRHQCDLFGPPLIVNTPNFPLCPCDDCRKLFEEEQQRHKEEREKSDQKKDEAKKKQASEKKKEKPKKEQPKKSQAEPKPCTDKNLHIKKTQSLTQSTHTHTNEKKVEVKKSCSDHKSPKPSNMEIKLSRSDILSHKEYELKCKSSRSEAKETNDNDATLHHNPGSNIQFKSRPQSSSSSHQTTHATRSMKLVSSSYHDCSEEKPMTTYDEDSIDEIVISEYIESAVEDTPEEPCPNSKGFIQWAQTKAVDSALESSPEECEETQVDTCVETGQESEEEGC